MEEFIIEAMEEIIVIISVVIGVIVNFHTISKRNKKKRQNSSAEAFAPPDDVSVQDYVSAEAYEYEYEYDYEDEGDGVYEDVSQAKYAALDEFLERRNGREILETPVKEWVYEAPREIVPQGYEHAARGKAGESAAKAPAAPSPELGKRRAEGFALGRSRRDVVSGLIWGEILARPHERRRRVSGFGYVGAWPRRPAGQVSEPSPGSDQAPPKGL